MWFKDWMRLVARKGRWVMQTPLWGVIPFAVLLLGIAIIPQTKLGHAFESNAVKLIFALVCGLPVAVWQLVSGNHLAVAEAAAGYAQFMCVVATFFVISGTIVVTGDIKATPKNNVIFMALGSVLSMVLGTTGAAMLLLRPLMSTNSERTHRAHTVVFFIFIVCNAGGLSPVGAPLFMGLIKGVPFVWFTAMFVPWLILNSMLLVQYWSLDMTMYSKEPSSAIRADDTQVEPIRISGLKNLLFVLISVVAVAMAPSIDVHEVAHGHLNRLIPWREMFMAAAAATAVMTTRNGPSLNLGPVKEVGALFIGIFLAMIPALALLVEVAPKLPVSEYMLFTASGAFSSVLDNAAAFLCFFDVAKAVGGENLVAGVRPSFLLAVSLGTATWGALTYIGNAPNMLVASTAASKEEKGGGIPMPSFGGYAVQAIRYLLPNLILLMFIIFGDGMVRWGAVAVALGKSAFHLVIGLRQSDPHNKKSTDDKVAPESSSPPKA